MLAKGQTHIGICWYQNCTDTTRVPSNHYAIGREVLVENNWNGNSVNVTITETNTIKIYHWFKIILCQSAGEQLEVKSYYGFKFFPCSITNLNESKIINNTGTTTMPPIST